jgi:hypothetical protein
MRKLQRSPLPLVVVEKSRGRRRYHRRPVRVVLPYRRRREHRGITTEYVVTPYPSDPWSSTKTPGNDNDEQVVVVSLSLLPLPSRLCLFLPPYSSRRLLLILSAVTWHRPSSSFGRAAVGGDVAVLGGAVGVVGGCDVAWLGCIRGGVEGR